MSDPTPAVSGDPQPDSSPDDAAVPATPDALVEDELLVEDVSIDGMCGVY
jgi:mycofactocin precursor